MLRVETAAEACGVPKSTLKDRLSGRVEHGCRPSPKPYLRPDEGELTTYILTAASIGLGKTRHKVMRIAEDIAVHKGILKGNKISNGWWRQFHDKSGVIPTFCVLTLLMKRICYSILLC